MTSVACLCVEVLLISVIFSGICTFKLHEFMLWQQTASTKTIPIQKVKILFSHTVFTIKIAARFPSKGVHQINSLKGLNLFIPEIEA